MAILKHECPHCRIKDIALSVSNIQGRGNAYEAAIQLWCPRCRLPCGALIFASRGGLETQDLLKYGGDPQDQGWKIKAFWPVVPGPNVPEFLPPDVERIYLQAERNFDLAGNEEASGMMYRKALDVAVKNIDPSLSGMLGTKLKNLSKQGKLTGDIAVWADQVRDLGNEATHDETPISREDLKDLRNFAEMVLRYLFTLPNMVRKRRGDPLPWESPQ